MFLKQSGHTLIELVISISIVITIACTSISWLHDLIYVHYAKLSLRQILLAINYARSVAVLHRETVTICPSLDRYTCNNNWNSGIIVKSPSSYTRYFKLFFTNSSFLYLQQSGFTNYKIEIEANGISHTNGHFSYKALSSSNQRQFCLYFNKMLRSYFIEHIH